jgi:translocation and assembly module TamB
VDGTVGAKWASRIQDGVARVHLLIRNSGAATSSSTIPLSGLIDVTYDGARNVASFDSSNLKTGNTTITVTGILSNHSQLNTEVNTSGLHELAALVSTFESGPQSSKNTLLLSDLHGSARFDGQVLGSIKDPRIKGELFANNFEVQKTRWNSLHMNLDAASTDVSLQNGSLQDTQNGQITFNARSSLQNWTFTSSSSISLQVQTKQLAVGDLQQLANLHYPVSGVLSANIAVHGSQDNPEGQGSLQLSRASAWNQPINNLNADFKGDGNSIHSTVKLTAPNGSLNGELTYLPKAQSYEATLQSSEIKLDQLPAQQIRALNISGNARISASAHGTLSDPQVAANLQLSQLRIRNQAFFDTQAQLNLANRRADFSLNAKADQGIIQASGNVALIGEYPVTASLDIRAIPIATVVSSYLHANPKLQGTAEVHANLKGPLKNPTAIMVQLEIPQLNLAYESTNLALVRPLRINYQNDVATIEDGEVKGPGTDFSIKGAIPVKSGMPVNLAANGNVDLSVIQGFVPDVRSSGRIDLNVSARGDLLHPAMQGQIHIVNATASSEDIPVGLEGINGLLQISGNRIEVAQLSGAAGGGTVAARGFMTYGQPSSFNLGLDLKSVRLRYPQGVRSILSGNLALNGNERSSELTGRVLIDRLSFTQQFDLANFLSQFSTEAPAATSSLLERNMKLNVALDTAHDVDLANNKLSIAGAANLIFSGTMADPVVLGRTTLASGEIFFMGKRYTIQGGTIEFANTIQTVPILNLNVSTTVQQYNITLNFTGPPDRLKTNYTSDPPLPPADIINLIAFGKTSEQAASSPSTPASVGAESVLAQGAASQLSSKIESVTGITQLSIDPLAANSPSNTGSVVAIQQRVTGNILFTFSTDVTSTENQSVQLQYKVKKNLSISVLRDTYDGYAVDVRIHKSF